MSFVSITRLRLRSAWHLPSFVWHTIASTNQLVKSKGFLKGKALIDSRLTFWTASLWQSEADMRAYRNSDAHKKAMPKLQHWCDEASIVHWQQEDEAMPDWHGAHRRMMEEGRLSKLKHPAPTHALEQIPAPRYPSKTERILLPQKKS